MKAEIRGNFLAITLALPFALFGAQAAAQNKNAPTEAPSSPVPEQLGPVVLDIQFQPKSSKLNSVASTELASLADNLRGTGNRLEMIAYAIPPGTAEATVDSRRLALARLLSVRSFLVDQDVSASQLDVRALLKKAPQGKTDSIELRASSTRTIATGQGEP